MVRGISHRNLTHDRCGSSLVYSWGQVRFQELSHRPVMTVMGNCGLIVVRVTAKPDSRLNLRPPAYFRGWRTDAPPRWGEHLGSGLGTASRRMGPMGSPVRSTCGAVARLPATVFRGPLSSTNVDATTTCNRTSNGNNRNPCSRHRKCNRRSGFTCENLRCLRMT